ncbi:MAG: hypothetical protein EAZ99_01025 [Alphaproteobacteria bacterium]|nr:MAG: hypothetical protein EAZ99_01025 [Alphaproteobacteria bacterium]
MIHRRHVLAGLGAGSLAACEGTTGRVLLDRARGALPYTGFQDQYIRTERVANAIGAAPRVRPGVTSRPVPDAMDANLEQHWVVQDSRLNAYVRRIADRILDQWPGPRPSVQVWILQTETARIDISQSHDVFLSLYWLNAVTTEDALAFLIAHEISHVLLNHFDRDSFFKGYEAVIDLSMQVALLGISLASGRGSGQGAVTAAAEQAAGQALLTSMGTGVALTELAETFMNPIWTRQQEFEADMLAVDLVAKAGYAAAGVNEAFTLLNNWAKESDESAVNKAAEMKAKIDAEVAEATAKRGPSGAFEMALQGLVPLAGAVLGELRTQLQAKHPDIEARQANAFGYRDNRYENTPFDLMASQPPAAYTSAMKNPLVTPLLRVDRELVLLKQASTAGTSPSQAERLITQAERTLSRNHAPVLAATASFRVRQPNRRREARRQLNDLLRNELAPAQIYDLATRAALADRDFNDAQRVVDLGQTRFGSDRWFLAPAIMIAQERGDTQAAQRLYAACGNKNSRPALESCNNVYRSGPKRQQPGRSILDDLRSVFGT